MGSTPSCWFAVMTSTVEGHRWYGGPPILTLQPLPRNRVGIAQNKVELAERMPNMLASRSYSKHVNPASLIAAPKPVTS